MLKKTITYTDYNGSERTEDFYFNLSKAEAMEMATKDLLTRGFVKGSTAFQKELDKYWRENKIAELPLK